VPFHRAYDQRMLPQNAMFSRTQNDNGSYNSRCLDCFMTIAQYVPTEEELERREANHICPEKALADRLEKQRTASPASSK
jgi:hypothetical protein